MYYKSIYMNLCGSFIPIFIDLYLFGIYNLKSRVSIDLGKECTASVAYKDLSGRRFGKLTVLGPSELRANGFIVWNCRCDCGNIKGVTTANLTSGRTKSCGCARIQDLTGQQFGKLTVLRKTASRRSGFVVWECICQCGNTTAVTTNNLTGGTVRSCGCSRHKDLSGMRFGMLTAVQPTDQRKRGHIIWQCFCDCGNSTLVTSSDLLSGSRTSCGCTEKKQDVHNGI